jgi:6-phosphogluconolactonase
VNIIVKNAAHRDQVALFAALALEEAAALAVAQRGEFFLALSGGQSPLPLFQLLSRPEWAGRLPWEKTTVAWVDERCVPAADEASNYGSARAVLEPLARARLVLPISGELPPEEGARRYAQSISQAFLGRTAAVPRFDCLLLGMGADGHTASLFPESSGLQETRRTVVAQRPPALPHARVTLTLPVLNAARRCLFLVTGKEKYPALRLALALLDPPVLPVQRVRPADGVLHWIIDQEAATGICARACHAGARAKDKE